MASESDKKNTLFIQHRQQLHFLIADTNYHMRLLLGEGILRNVSRTRFEEGFVWNFDQGHCTLFPSVSLLSSLVE